MEQVAVPLLAALVAGLLARRVGLPPLVGYLAAGFALGVTGVRPGPALDVVADLGVLLLLFGIGLKLRVGQLLQAPVLVGATVHMALSVLLGAGFLALLVALGVPVVDQGDVGQRFLLAFALAFSSTVFAVKALEQFGETSSTAGRLAIGVLVVQDVVAVVFLAVVAGVPSIWAVPAVAALVLARPLLGRLLEAVGTGELLALAGAALALGVGAYGFELVGLKPDLGALVVGMLLAGHPRAADLSASLLSAKELLLVGFFLSIGLAGVPDVPTLLAAAALLLLVPLKAGLHLVLLSRFRLRARTAWHASVTLANHSEFGLIVVAVGVTEGLLPDTWSTLVAVAVAASFALASPPNGARYELYERHHDRLVRLERHPVRAEDALIDPTGCAVMVFGMGRIGTGAYDEFSRAQEADVVGVDRRDDVVQAHLDAGRHVLRGDALDPDFWERVRLRRGLVLAVLAMSDHEANLRAAHQIRASVPGVEIAATATRPDEVDALRDAGVMVARDLYGEAGQGLADDAVAALTELHWSGLPAGSPLPTSTPRVDGSGR